jgi:hypothetical protein
MRCRDSRGHPAIKNDSGAILCARATRKIWIADAHRDEGRRFVVRADDLLSAFVELERQVLTVTFYLQSIRAVNH